MTGFGEKCQASEISAKLRQEPDLVDIDITYRALPSPLFVGGGRGGRGVIKKDKEYGVWGKGRGMGGWVGRYNL